MDVATPNLGQFRIEGTYSGAFIQQGNAITVGGISGVGAVISSGTFTGGSGTVSITGSFTQSGGTFNVGSGTVTLTGAFAHSAGTFNGGTAAITVTSTFTLSGTAAFTSTTNTLTINGNLAIQNSSSFNPNNGTVKLLTTGTLTTFISITMSFYKLELGTNGSTATYTVGNSGGSTLDAISEVTLSGSDALIINGAGAIRVTNNGTLKLLNTSTAGGGTGTIVMDGTGTQTVQGATTIYQNALPKLSFNKSGGSLTITNYVTITNNFTYTVTGTTVTTTGSTLIFTGAATNGASNTSTINGSGTFSLNHLTFETVSSTDRIFDITGGLILHL